VTRSELADPVACPAFPHQPPDPDAARRALVASLDRDAGVQTYLAHSFTIQQRANDKYAATITGPDGKTWPTEVAFHFRASAELDAMKTIDRRLEDEHRAMVAETEANIAASRVRDVAFAAAVEAQGSAHMAETDR
jgi:hypothetical protein